MVGRFAIVDASVARRARARSTPLSGWPRSSRTVSTSGSTSRGDRVLLVDDLVVTGWTLTLAARALRAAAASDVLPLTLAVQA